MIKAGTIFCPYCCRTHQIPFYSHGKKAVGVELHYKNNTYDIVEKELKDPDKPELGLQTPNTKNGLRLVSSPEASCAGLPLFVEVLFPEEPESLMMQRTCPHCGTPNKYAEMGTLPMLIVGMVGNRASGKSALLNSVALPSHHAQVTSCNYPYAFDIAPHSFWESEAAATPRMGRGMTKLLTIKHVKSRTPIVHVLLLDVSGELLEKRPSESSSDSDSSPAADFVSQAEIVKILSGSAGYPGVDAAIFADTVPGSVPLTKDYLVYNPVQIRNDCEDVCPNFCKIPIAYVMTHLDHYYNSRKFPQSSQGYPLMTADTFNNSSYTTENLINRIITEDSIVRQLPNFALADRDPRITMGFLAQSCSCRQEGNVKIERYTDSKNVMDPLLWILNKLHVFPLTSN